MKIKFLTSIALVLFVFGFVQGQSSYFDGKFTVRGFTHYDQQYTLYDFSREGKTMKAKYFATNAYQQYLDWKAGKEILLVVPGAFSDGWEKSAKPVGLCVDNGKIVNRSPDSNMDGMVIVYNGSTQIGGIAIVDMDKSPVNCETSYGSGQYKDYYPRTSSTDRTIFMNWGESNGLTLFQTQLVFSEKKASYENFQNLTYGEQRERRFLAICRKNGDVHHVVVNAPEKQYLNTAAKRAKEVLDFDGFQVLYMLNLDTGWKNLMYAYNGSYLEDLKPSTNENATIDRATNLLIYYKD